VWQKSKQTNFRGKPPQEGWSWGPVEGSADYLFMRGCVAFSTSHCTGRFLVTIKFWESAALKNRAAIASVSPGVREGGNRMTAGAILGAGVVKDDLEANHNAHKPPDAILCGRKGIQATTYTMLTFHEFLAMKAKVYPDLFRIQPFIGLAQPIPLKPTPKPGRRLRGGEKRSKGR
jgi:hypothetical protein